MYCKFEEAFTCLLWGRYQSKHIRMIPLRIFINWFIITIYMVEGIKLIAINVANDDRVKFYLAEVHFSKTVVQYYFNTAMCLCFFGSAWVSIRFYVINKHGSRYFSFCDLYFRTPRLVQTVLDLPEAKFYKQLRNARKFYRAGTVLKNFFWSFFVIPTLLNARTSYDILGTLYFVAFSIPFSVSSMFGYLFAALVYKDSFLLFINYINFQVFRLQTLRSRLNNQLETKDRQLSAGTLFRCRLEFNKILSDFYASHMLFKVAPAFFIVAGTLIGTITMYLGCFIVEDLFLMLFITGVAVLIVLALSVPLPFQNMTFMEQTQLLDHDWYSVLARKHVSIRGKMKLLGTLSLQQNDRMLTYTFNDTFDLTRYVLFNIIINMGTTIMLIFQSQSKSGPISS